MKLYRGQQTTLTILNIGTDGPYETAQTPIRLSYQDPHCLPLHLHL